MDPEYYELDSKIVQRSGDPSLNMSNAPKFHEYDAKSGPQVALTDLPDLPEAVSTPVHKSYWNNPAVGRYATAVELSNRSSRRHDDKLPPSGTKKSLWTRRRTIILMAMICTIIVIAAIIGCVVGSRISANSSSSLAPSSSIASATSTASAASTTSTLPVTVPTPTSAPVSPKAAYNGTSFSVLYYQVDGTPTTGNYVLFYQQADGDIQKIIYNESQWHAPEFVTSDARLGSGLASVWLGSPIKIYLYYIDTNSVLQELRGHDGSNDWVNGTLGLASFRATSSYSHLDSIFFGQCENGVSGWVNYEGPNGHLTQAIWDQNTDSWTSGITFPDTKPGSDFVTELEDGPGGPWRIFTMNQDTTLQEYVCTDCCSSPSNNTFEMGLSNSASVAGYSGLGGSNVGAPRILYYQSLTNAIQALNSTGDDSNETMTIDSDIVTYAMPGSRLAMAAGFQGTIQTPYVFYQSNSTSIDFTYRLSPDNFWEPGTALPIGV